MVMKTAPELTQSSAKKHGIGIAVAQFNPHITGELLQSAQVVAKENNLVVVKVLHVPGSLELPFAAQRLLKEKEIEGVACLGAILKGSTLHDEVIGNAVTRALLDLSLKYDKPLGQGIIGPGATEAMAKERAAEYGRRAVLALRHMFDVLE